MHILYVGPVCVMWSRGLRSLAERIGNIRMSNSRPPYQGQGSWDQGAYPAQNPYGTGGYVPQQNPQDFNGQQNYAPVNGYDQAGYAPQAGYAAPTGNVPMDGGYQAPMDNGGMAPNYGQVPQGGYYPPQGYGQPNFNGNYDAQGYAQTPQMTPDASGYAAPQEVQGEYPQFSADGQQLPPNNHTYRTFPTEGLSGFQTGPMKKNGLPMEAILRISVCVVLPVLYLIAMLTGWAPLKWICAAGFLGGAAALWTREVVSPNLRLTLTLVFAALAVVSVVSAVSAPARQEGNYQTNFQGNGAGYMTNQNLGQQNGDLPTVSVTPTPTSSATATADPNIANQAAYDQLQSFFNFWSANDVTSMMNYVSPSWRQEQGTQEKQNNALYLIMQNRRPLEWTFLDITGTAYDASRTVSVQATIDKRNTTTPAIYLWKVRMIKNNDVWYVDPQSLQSNEQETTARPEGNTTATQPPLFTGAPNLVLYYNPDGGSRYHIDPNCSSTNKKFCPMKGQFYFSEVNDPQYSRFTPCNVCGAPKRPE